MSFEWHEYAKQDYFEQCALAVFEILKRNISTQGHVRIHVSGGKSPIPFFERLSLMPLEWEKVSVSLVDERIVECTHQESNTALVKRYLLKECAKSAKWIPLLKEPLGEKTQAHVNELVHFARLHYKQPDVLVLGMGSDGHMASIFPDSRELDEALNTQDDILYTQTPSSEYDRLSMSLAAIEKTPTLFLFIQGQKRAIFEKAAFKKDKKFPISYILHSTKVLCHVYYSEL